MKKFIIALIYTTCIAGIILVSTVGFSSKKEQSKPIVKAKVLTREDSLKEAFAGMMCQYGKSMEILGKICNEEVKKSK
jgi:hypothetical protein